MPRGVRNDPSNDAPFPNDDWGEPMEYQTGPDDSMPETGDDTYLKYLKPYHLKQMRGTLELVEVSTESSEYSDVILIVKAGTRSFRLGLRTFSDEYKALKKRFGHKRSDWHGQLQYRILPHKGNPRGFVAVR